MIRRRRLPLALLPVVALCFACGPSPPPAVAPAPDRKEVREPSRGEGPSPPAGSASRHALLVGCTRYPNLEGTFAHLQGPGNDVVLMRQVLKDRFGFKDENIVTLAEAAGADKKPTRAHIKREFDRLARIAKKGDQVVILLAGHGSQQPDQEPFDEADGLDETFLPADAGPWLEDKGRVANAIVDDELGVWTRAITDRGAGLWVIVDACHSGTMLRGDSAEVAREVPADQLVPRAALEKARTQAAERFKGAAAGGSPAHWADEAPGLVAIYAAQPTEPTVERKPYDGSSDKMYGLLTYTLCKVLTTAQSPLSYQELTQRIHAEYVRHGRASPIPLVEGKHVDREVLGLRSWPGRSRFLLRKDGEGWKVNGGHLHGLTEKSILAVYPPAGSAAADKILGHVRIQASHVTEAEVVPCAHAGMEVRKDLPPGGRCEPVYRDYGELQLSVAVAGDAADAGVRALKKHLQSMAAEKGSLIALAADAKQAEWLFRIEKGAAVLSPAYAAASEGKAGRAVPRFGPYRLDDADGIRVRLERIARVRNLLKLTSASTKEAARGSPAAGEENAELAVALTLLKLRSKEDREGTPVKWKDRGAVLAAGDWIAFRVQNGSRFAVDVSLLFVDSGFGIEPVFPRPGIAADNRLQPGQSYRTGAFRVNAKTVGLEHVTLIAVRAAGQQLDFTCLAQPSLERAVARGGDENGLRSPLGKLLTSALYGQGTTRGLDMEEIDNHALRLLSWYVEPADAKGKKE